MRRWLVGVSLYVLAAPAWASQSVWVGGTSSALNTAATAYNVPNGAGYYAWNTTEGYGDHIMPTAGTIGNLRVTITAAPGSGITWTFTVRQNAGPTSLACTISGTSAVSCQDTDTVSVVATDKVSVESSFSGGTPAAASARWTMTFDGSTAAESVLTGTSGSAANTGTAAVYLSLVGQQDFNTTQVRRELVVPTSGTIKSLYVNSSVGPGAGLTVVYTVQLNGADSAITCSLSDTATSCNDTANTVAVVATDRLSVEHDLVSGTSGSMRVDFGVVFLADTNGEFIVGETASGLMGTAATQYGYASAGFFDWNTTETNVDSLAQSFTVNRLEARLVDGVAGTGGTYTFTFRQNAGPTDLSCAISGATARTCNDTTPSVTVANDDLLGYEQVPAGPPTARRASISLLGFISPTGVARRVTLWD